MLLLIKLLMGLLTLASADEMQHELDKLKQDPKAYMIGEDLNLYRDKLLQHEKERIRTRLLGVKKRTAPIGSGDRIEDFLEGESPLLTLQEVDAKKLYQARLPRQPWSDYYWPIYKGILGNRYADDEFSALMKWPDFMKHILDHPWNQAKRNKLSPSEKYDLLSGEHLTLTQNMWEEGRYYYENYGKVETWMGICHGWAAAAYMLGRPLSAVTVQAYDGKPITFYPSEIKALASLLWSNTRVPTLFSGGRCNNKEPKLDEKTGRILDSVCFDTNPATFHFALINKIGVDQESFVMDATFSYEVWNQPILSYSFEYFNPITKDRTPDRSKATVELAQYSDPLKKFRSKEAKFVVGIAMRVQYMNESVPTQNPEDSEEFDRIRTVNYLYDLEIDSKGAVVGGEWYRNQHPDFLWTPHRSSRALSGGDYSILDDPPWDGKEPLPDSWKDAARFSGQRSQPLARVVESLIELSRMEAHE